MQKKANWRVIFEKNFTASHIVSKLVISVYLCENVLYLITLYVISILAIKAKNSFEVCGSCFSLLGIASHLCVIMWTGSNATNKRKWDYGKLKTKLELNYRQYCINISRWRTAQLCRFTQDSGSVTLITFPIHQLAQCQAYCHGYLPGISYLPDLWLFKWMTPAWFPMSDDISGLVRGFQTDPLVRLSNRSPHMETNLSVYVRLRMHVMYLFVSVNVYTAHACVVMCPVFFV